MPALVDTENVAVIVGLVPTSPAGVSIAHSDNSPLVVLLLFPLEVILVKVLPALSLTLLVVTADPLPQTSTAQISLVPALTLAVVKATPNDATLLEAWLALADWRRVQATRDHRPCQGTSRLVSQCLPMRTGMTVTRRGGCGIGGAVPAAGG